jgi:2-C-methyl-D-erythritol 4-phosphate cytidylyltransferase
MVYALVLAGGVGSRMGNALPKQFLRIGRTQILALTLEKFQSMKEIDGIVIASHIDHILEVQKIARNYRINKLAGLVKGGETRQISSYNALLGFFFNDLDIVLIHDAARPFVSEKTIRDCISAARMHGAAGVYVPAKDTIAEVKDNFVHKTLSRETLQCAQTPQAFRYGIIMQAHKRAREMNITNATDDASLVLAMGEKVFAVQGDYQNIKITTPDDLPLAELIAKKIMAKRNATD